MGEGHSIAGTGSELGWFPLHNEATISVAGYIWGVGLRDDVNQPSVVARFTLTIRDPEHVYDVLVPRDCYDATRVGDPWPSELEECR